MVYSTRTIERVSIVAAILGLVQGSVWFLWGLFSIFTYYDILHLNFEAQSIPYFMSRIFVGENDRTIIIFMFLYAVLSLTLCVFSALIIKETLQAKSPTLVLLVYVSWSVNMVILSLVDIVLTCFLGRDLSDLFYQPETPAENLIDAYTIILLVSMRGVILWIINIMFSGYITIFGFQFSRSGFSRSDDIINAFEDSKNSLLDWTAESEYLKKILKKQDIMEAVLSKTMSEIESIKISLSRTNNYSENPIRSTLFEKCDYLPINTQNDLERFEAFLNEAANMDTSVTDLSKIGGTSTYNFIFRAATGIITNKYAGINYSFLGRKNKQKFKDLKLCTLLSKAAQIVSPLASHSEIETSIAKWLRRCTERGRKE